MNIYLHPNTGPGQFLEAIRDFTTDGIVFKCRKPVEREDREPDRTLGENDRNKLLALCPRDGSTTLDGQWFNFEQKEKYNTAAGEIRMKGLHLVLSAAPIDLRTIARMTVETRKPIPNAPVTIIVRTQHEERDGAPQHTLSIEDRARFRARWKDDDTLFIEKNPGDEATKADPKAEALAELAKMSIPDLKDKAARLGVPWDDLASPAAMRKRVALAMR